MTIDLYLGDCLEVLKTLPSGSVDAVVTDPPYGIHLRANYLSTRKASQLRDMRSHAWLSKDHARIEGDDRPFDPVPLLNFKTVILWGANNYADRLPPRYSWLVWDKKCGANNRNGFSDCELCWCNGVPFNSVRIFRHMWTGYQRDSEIGEGSLHPTQKPISLMKWCMDVAKIPVGATVLDPFMGSGTTGVACVQTGRNFIGIEISEEYFKIAEKRITEAQAQPRLFGEPASQLPKGDAAEAEPQMLLWNENT